MVPGDEDSSGGSEDDDGRPGRLRAINVSDGVGG